MKSYIFIFSLVITLHLCHAEYYGPVSSRFDLLLGSIRKLVNFYSEEYKTMNLDGIFGLRCLQGELMYLTGGDIYIGGETVHLPQDILTQMTSLLNIVAKIGHLAVQELENKDTEYFAQTGFLVAYPWQPSVHFRRVQSSVVFPEKDLMKYEVIKEQFSDRCLTELHDTSVKYPDFCRPSPACIKTMVLREKLIGYDINHQVLYTTLAQKMGCYTQLNKVLRDNGTSIYNIQLQLCSNIHAQSVRIVEEHGSQIPEDLQDLYMEQVFVCGSIGFMELVNEKMMETVLKWQHPTLGCFGDNLKFRRHLLEEISLKEGCMAHKSAVAAGALAVFLRLFLDPRVSAYIPSDTPSLIKAMIAERKNFMRNQLPELLQDGPSDHSLPEHEIFQPIIQRPQFQPRVLSAPDDNPPLILLWAGLVLAVIMLLWRRAALCRSLYSASMMLLRK